MIHDGLLSRAMLHLASQLHPRWMFAAFVLAVVILVADRLLEQALSLDDWPVALGMLCPADVWQAYEQLLRRKRRSQDTIDLYDGVLHNLWRWLDQQHSRAWREITPELADEWLEPRRGWTATTYGRVAQRLYRRAAARGWLDGGDPLEDWVPPSPPPRRPRALPVGKIGELLQEVDPRIRMMVLLGYWQGLRVGEIVKLRVEDVTLSADPPRILIQGKGGKDVWDDLADGLVGPLRAFIATRPGRGPLIPNRNDPARHLDAGYAACLLAAAMRPVVGDSGHALRHTHGKLLRRLTKDPYVVRDALRHSSLAMQDIYIDADHELLRLARAQLPDPLKEAW